MGQSQALRRLGPAVRLLCACLLVLGTTQASLRAGTVDPSALPGQRKAFQEAEQALRAGRGSRFTELLAQLEDYPLYPYLLYEDLRRRLSRARPEAVDEFLTRYADTPLAPRLRRSWIKRLHEQQRWAKLIGAYEPGADTATRCRYLEALLRDAKRSQALEQVQALWLVGHSQPDACDPVFDAWRAAGRLTAELIWARIALAMEAGHPGLARYLARFLPEAEREWVELWRRVRSYPSLVLTEARLRRDSYPMVEPIVLYGAERWAWREPEKAAAGWERIRQRHDLDPEAAAQVERALGLSLARNDEDVAALRWLGDMEQPWTDVRVRETRPLIALRAGDWPAALQWIERLKPEERAQERWRYWRARALEQLGRQGPANDLFAELAGERSFYGFLAADRRALPYSLNDSPINVSESELQAMASLPAMRRARELQILGRTVSARREWYHLTRDMDAHALQVAAVLAHRWGWHDRAILALGRTGKLDDLSVRFPLAFREPVMRQARDHALDPAWVFAVMRQESAFYTDARSPRGALGLMQLLPRTASYVARKLNSRLGGHHELLQADTNIRLGSAYLRRLLDDLDEHPALATAAYNAGPSRVKRWMPKDKEMPADLWIESVPFRETHKYLRRVFTYTAIYEDRLGEAPTRLSRRLKPVPARSNG